MRLRLASLLAAGLLAAGCAAARAEVVAFDLLAPPAPAFGGRAFGEAGAYERIAARATIAVDPADPRNAAVADLSLAPRGADGRVRATADVVLLRPAARANGTLLVEAPNRGRELVGQLLHGAPAANGLVAGTDPGDGHLLRRGYTLAWVGWQFDVPAGQGPRLEAPVLAGVAGPSREEFVFDHTNTPVAVPLTYPMATEAGAALTVRQWPGDARQTPPGLSFRALDPRRVEITRPAEGFDAAALYEFAYTARDPVVAGLGLVALRDVAAFLRRGDAPGNPLARDGRAGVDRAILIGVSQSGRVVRDFLYAGLNEDSRGDRGVPVYDALMPHIPGARRSVTNARFAQPGRNPTPHTDRGYPADGFPFAYEASEDHLTGRRDGLLERCRATRTCPRIVQTDSEYEAWGSIASLLVTDTRGAPLALPPEVRAYMIAGHPHFAPAGGVAARTPACALPTNPLHAGPALRALLAAVEAWVREGVEPPPSRYPSAADGTLLPAEAVRYPAVAALPYQGLHAPAERWDAGVAPPAPLGRYAVLLPRVDPDGNMAAGVRLPALAVPRATYTGWNPRADGFAPGALCTNTGAVAPLAATRAERLAAGDPRPSIEERTPTPAAYAAAVRAAADALVADRLLLPEDADAAVAAAESGTLAGLPR